jgi:hypothetical protein
MSAFIVSDATIDALVTYAIGGGSRRATNLDPQEAGQLLVNENYRSCNHRYRGERGEPHTYSWRPYPRPLTPVEAIKLCNHYDYQACETDDYEKTEAANLIRQIRDKAIHSLPGYDEAPWGLPDDQQGPITFSRIL